MKRKTLRETYEDTNRGLRMWAAAHGKPIPEGVLVEVKPKRERKMSDAPKVGRGSEHNEQCAVIAWWRKWHGEFGCKEFQLFAIPNGGSRDIITGARLKAEGVRRGTPDLFLAVPSGAMNGLFCEMKYNKGKLSDEQKEFLEVAAADGYATATCWTAEEAIAAIKN